MAYQKGLYLAKVAGQMLSKSSNKGTDQFVLTFYPIAEIDRETREHYDCEDGERSLFFYLTENTIKRVVEDLRSLGFDRNSFLDLDPSTPNHFSFVDKEIEVECDLETYEGKERERWRLAGAGGMQLKPMEDSDKRRLDALFGKCLKSSPPATTPASVPLPAIDQPKMTKEKFKKTKSSQEASVPGEPAGDIPF